MKKCLTCELEKSLTEFYKRPSSSDGVGYHCKPCARNLRNKWNNSKDEHYWRDASYARASRHTGIPIEIIYEAIEAQEYKCKICKTPEGDKFLAVDHCHKTGKLRGLLCQKCNTGLGLFQDNPELLKTAISYLE